MATIRKPFLQSQSHSALWKFNEIHLLCSLAAAVAGAGQYIFDFVIFNEIIFCYCCFHFSTLSFSVWLRIVASLFRLVFDFQPLSVPNGAGYWIVDTGYWYIDEFRWILYIVIGI